MSTQDTTAKSLQMARECIAATYNQDDTLTVPEARGHAAAALTHIEQAEEAYDAMREALEEMVGYALYGFDGLHDKSVTRAVKRAQAALALANGSRER